MDQELRDAAALAPSCALTTQQYFCVWNYVMAAIMKRVLSNWNACSLVLLNSRVAQTLFPCYKLDSSIIIIMLLKITSYACYIGE